jgi:hypothetical protein
MPVITTGTVVFGLIGAAILGVLGRATLDARLTWLETMLGDAEDRINEVSVYQLTKEQEHDLMNTARGDVLDSAAVLMALRRTGDDPSGMFKFTMHGEDGRLVIWHQRMPDGEFFPTLFQVGTSRDRTAALKYKRRFKAIGAEAYTMWKMSQP